MTGKQNGLAVVTGATGMLGRATALALSRRGATVVLVARDPSRGRQVLDQLDGGGHRLLSGDLSNPDRVRALAADITAIGAPVRALVHTAATLTPQRQQTPEHHELMFATNVLARFLLTREITPRFAPGARVLTVTGPSPDALNFEDLMARARFEPFLQFRATNAANILFALELARRLEKQAVQSNAYHPGVLQSELMKKMPAPVRWITFPFGRSAEKASQALAALAWDPRHSDKTGLFFKLETPMRVPRASRDRRAQERLWVELERLLDR